MRNQGLPRSGMPSLPSSIDRGTANVEVEVIRGANQGALRLLRLQLAQGNSRSPSNKGAGISKPIHQRENRPGIADATQRLSTGAANVCVDILLEPLNERGDGFLGTELPQIFSCLGAYPGVEAFKRRFQTRHDSASVRSVVGAHIITFVLYVGEAIGQAPAVYHKGIRKTTPHKMASSGP